MTLSKYIKQTGFIAAAELFKVSIHTVKKWHLGYRKPRTKKALYIVKVTGGKVTMEGIYNDRKEST